MDLTGAWRGHKARRQAGTGRAAVSRLLGVLAGVALLVVSGGSHAQPLGAVTNASLVDQQQPLVDRTVGGIVLGGQSDQKLAQTVTAGITGALTGIHLALECSSYQFRVEIQAVGADGRPNGGVLGSPDYPAIVRDAEGWARIELSEPVFLTAGTRFAIVLSSFGGCVSFRGPIGNPYSGGNLFFDSRPNAPGVWVCVCDFGSAERWDLPFKTIVDAGPTPVRWVAGDLGGDGKTDIMWRKTGAGVDKGAMFLWTMDGTGLSGSRYLDPISEDWQVQFMGDFNGDGKGDVLWRNFGTGADAGKLYIWMMDGPSVIGTGYTGSQADLGWRVDGVGDLNGDGKSDIVWRKTGAGVDPGAVFLWTMDGTALAGARYLDPISEDWQVVDLDDFNGDGKADILWRNMSDGSADAGQLYIWQMNGPTLMSGTGYTASQADLGWRVDGVGDLNGDGKSDIVWRKTAAGVDQGALYLWTMTGKMISGSRYLDPISEDWQVQGLGDFNGDGKTDILWRNQGSGTEAGNLYVWMMDGPNVVGGTGYTAAQADLGWRVDNPRARILTPVLLPTVPMPLLPLEGAVLDNGCYSGSNAINWDFAWSRAAGATAYNLYVRHTGASLPIIDRTITGTTYSYASNGWIADSNRRDWRYKIRAFKGGAWGAFGPERSFDVEPVNTDCSAPPPFER
jgi:hypothetical protein